MREGDLFSYCFSHHRMAIVYTEKTKMVSESFDFFTEADDPDDAFTLTVWDNFKKNVPYVITLDHEDFEKGVKIEIPKNCVSEDLAWMVEYCRLNNGWIPVARCKKPITQAEARYN